MTLLVEPDSTLVAAPPWRTRLYYGWVMLPVAMAAFIATSPGQTFGVSIFNEPMRLSLDLSHGQLASAYTCGTLAAALPLAYIGALIDRHGLRRAMTAAVLLFGLSCFAAAQAGGWLTLFAAFLALRLLGPGALALLSSNTLAHWFHRRLGLAEGLRHVGMAGAMAVIPALNLWLLGHFGWRGAYAALGLAVWAVMLPLLLLFREHPGDLGQTIDGLDPGEGDDDALPKPLGANLTLGEALATRSFWIVAGGTATFGIVHTGVFFCIVSIFLDRGLAAGDAAAMLTSFAASLAVFQLTGGILADRVPPTRLMPPALAGLAVSMLLLARLSQPWMAQVCGAVMGAAQGLYFASSNPLWARYYGRLHLGKIRGLLSSINVGTASLGPLLLGVFRDLHGSYDLILALFAIVPLPLVCLSCCATPPPPRHA